MGDYFQNNINNPGRILRVSIDTQLNSDESVVVVNSSAAPVTITLPPVNTIPGNSICIQATNGATNIVTIVPSAGDTVNGVSSVVLSIDKESITLTSAPVNSVNGDWIISSRDPSTGQSGLTAVSVPALEALTSATVSAGVTATISRTGNVWVCTFADPAGSAWRPGDNVYRVRDYTTFSTSGWINFVIAETPATGGIVEIDAGTWTADQRIDILKDNIILRGAGVGRTTLIRGTALADAYLRIGTTAYAASPNRAGIIIENLAFDHATGGPAGSIGIDCNNATRVALRNIDIRNLDTGIRLQGESRYILAEQVYTLSCRIGCVLRNGARSNWIENCAFTGVMETGVLCEGGADAGCTQNVVRDCGIEGFSLFGVDLVSVGAAVVFRFDVKDTRIESTAPGAVGVRVGANCSFVNLEPYYQALTTFLTDGNPAPSNGETRTMSTPVSSFTQYGNAANGTRYALTRSGPGDPNNAVIGSPGDAWLRTDGGVGTSLYIKETGTATDTGWTAK